MLKKIDSKLNSVIVAIMAGLSSTMCFAFADETANNFGEIMRNLIYSFLPPLLTIGIAIATVSLAWQGVKLIMSSDTRSASEAKSAMLRIFIGLIILIMARVIIAAAVSNVQTGMAG